MDAALGPVVAALLKMGAPWMVCCVFIILFCAERKSKDQMAGKLYDLGMAMTKTNTEFNGTLNKVERDLDEIRRAR